jgi:hypothetical protein
MKSPEEYLEDSYNNNFALAMEDDEIKSEVIMCIKQAQIDAYNEALDDAVENATIEHIDLTSDEVFDYTDVLVDDDVEVRINKQSILKLKK